jgi:hypothetical protein
VGPDLRVYPLSISTLLTHSGLFVSSECLLRPVSGFVQIWNTFPFPGALLGFIFKPALALRLNNSMVSEYLALEYCPFELRAAQGPPQSFNYSGATVVLLSYISDFDMFKFAQVVAITCCQGHFAVRMWIVRSHHTSGTPGTSFPIMRKRVIWQGCLGDHDRGLADTRLITHIDNVSCLVFIYFML